MAALLSKMNHRALLHGVAERSFARQPTSLCTPPLKPQFEHSCSSLFGSRHLSQGPAHRCSAAAPAVEGAPSSESNNSSVIYSHPELYEAAFSYRDIKQEVKFLRDAYKRHSAGGQPLRSVLDLGCGPATHALELAHQTSVQVVGVELLPAMLEHAKSKVAAAASEGKLKGAVTLVQGDMRTASVPAPPAPPPAPSGFGGASSSSAAAGYDMVTCLLGTFCHMLSNKDALQALKTATGALRKGGLLLLELPHPGDLFDGTLIVGDGGREMWEVPRKDDKIMVEWGADFDNFDPVTQILDRTVSINVLKGDDVVTALEEVVPARQFTVQEVELLASAAGLEILALYGDMAHEDVGLDHEEAYRMVAVLRKP